MSYALSDMIIEVYENLGESSDLYPYGGTYGTVSLTTDGAKRILKWLNRAYRKVCNTQLADGTFIRFRSLERHAFFTQNVLNLVVASVPSSNTISITGLLPVLNKYSNWIIDLGAASADSQGTEQHLVISNTGANPPVLTLANPFTNTPVVGSKVNVYKKWWACSLDSSVSYYHTGEFIPIDPKEDFLSALWIYDIQSMRDIKRYEEKAPLRKNILTNMYPGMFWDLETPAGGWGAQATVGASVAGGIGGGIEFDVPPLNGLTYELHYYGLSEQLTSSSQMIMIPDQFTEMIIKWATKTGMLRDREWDAAYALRKEFEADMATAIQDGAMRFEYDNPYVWIDT
jgi:hypothetical protein